MNNTHEELPFLKGETDKEQKRERLSPLGLFILDMMRQELFGEDYISVLHDDIDEGRA